MKSLPPPRPRSASIAEMRAAVERLTESERRIRAAREAEQVANPLPKVPRT